MKQIDDTLLIPGLVTLHVSDTVFKLYQQCFIVDSVILDNPKIFEAGHIQRFILSEELLKVFLPCGIADRKQTRPFTLLREGLHQFSRLIFILAEMWLESLSFEILDS